MSSDTEAAIAAAQVAAAAQYAAAVQTSASNYQAAVQSATIQAQAEISIANIRSASEQQVESTRANATVQSAEIDSSWHGNVANIEAQSRISAANTAANAEIQSAEFSANAQVEAATIGASYQVQTATIDAEAREKVATTQANATVTSANLDLTGREYTADKSLTASNYQADAGVTAAHIRDSGETERLNISLGFAQQVFGQVFPLVESTAGAITGQSVGGGGIGFAVPPPSGGGGASPRMGFGGNASPDDTYTCGTYSARRLTSKLPVVKAMGWGGGDVPQQGIGFGSSPNTTIADAVAQTALPFISTSGVLTPAQIQQLVNAAVAKADQRAASDVRRLVGDLAGRGFSASSPIATALSVGINGQALQAQMAAASQLQIQSAKENADAIFAGQKAISDQFIQQEGVLNDAARTEATRVVGVLQAVCGMVGGLA
jgi:hypothetical protein